MPVTKRSTHRSVKKGYSGSGATYSRALRSFNQLAFRTRPGGVSLSPGTTQDFLVNVKPYVSIRVLLDNRSGSAANVTFNLIMLQPSRGISEAVGVLDTVVLAPGASYNRVFEVPGVQLDIRAQTATGTGTDTIDAFVYGLQI